MRRLSVLVAWLLLALPAVALAQSADAGAGGAAPAPSTEEIVSPDSPRASLARYVELCATGRYAEAAEFLDVPDPMVNEAQVLARRLKAVLDRHVWLDLEKVSPMSQGDRDDGLPPFSEEIARIPTSTGQADSVRLVRRNAQGGRWIFSRRSVEKINGWYEQLENRWILDHLPEPLLRPGPRDLLWWQWLALPALLALAMVAGWLFGWITRRVLSRLAARTETRWDDLVLSRTKGPIMLGWTLMALYFLLPFLGLYKPAEAFLHKVLHAGFVLVFFWALLRAVDVMREAVAVSPWATQRPEARSLVPLGAKITKVLVWGMAAIAIFSELGYPVASLLAGLGIGGIAFALAAQKTVENLFGAFSLGVDQPFRQGDFVKIEDFHGTVEAIGLRSTKIRTLDRTLISVPNGKLAEMRIESYAARDRIRLATMVGLVYGTTAEKMRQVLEGLERVLKEHPKIFAEDVVVRFKELGESSLNIEVMAWFMTSDWSEFRRIRQEILLSFMNVVEEAGTQIAFPTRTVHLVSGDGKR
ncbi:MAG: mechanosensitive ion channel [Deltaproteobacteria bacterium]|nr:mechanosensitive ion channel [Deltaproteobacteria bacterium]